MRNNQQYNVEWFYSYFVSNNGKINSFQEFHQYFNLLNLNDVLNYLDKKFSLFILTTKDGKFIKIIE